MTEQKRLVTEVSISVKDESCRITEKENFYGSLEISPENGFINRLIEETVSKLGITPLDEAPSIIVKTKTVWQ